MAIRYHPPSRWIRYDSARIANELATAKGAVMALTAVPYQREWVEKLQQIQLKMEVAGTSRIEGAEFTDRELEVALDVQQGTEALLTRSQKQARAAVQTYTWIAALPQDRPIDSSLVCEIHARLVTGCDDDHCPPGRLRGADCNVTFGMPRHRGVEGGKPCEASFNNLLAAVRGEFQEHDPLVQALALHYHLAAMHPFLDGNGRTARALESLMHQRAGLRNTAFIAMSNYYYDEKDGYLAALAEVRAQDHDLTPFLLLGLRGLAQQCQRLLAEIRTHMQKALYQNTMYGLFNRLESTRKRVIKRRQIEILKLLLEREQIEPREIAKLTRAEYADLAEPITALTRDFSSLLQLGAIRADERPKGQWVFSINLDWPSQITETAFFETIKQMPKSKTHNFLA